MKPYTSPDTLIAFYGETGSGKSSIVNALLEETAIVPTSGMRACTSVVVELRYNHDNDFPYKAQVQFITRAEFKDTLRTLFGDLADDNPDLRKEIKDPDTDAHKAWAQVTAVFPELQLDDLPDVTLECLMAHPNLECLGTQVAVNAHSSEELLSQVRTYIDSTDKAEGMDFTAVDDADKDHGGDSIMDGDDTTQQDADMAFWPLVKVVRIFCKSKALSTGAVIVDLPGQSDSNRARDAIAAKYLRHCDCIFVVAPIVRAVNNKVAMNLLGSDFKAQLKMDSAVGTVTFIASKTDSIRLGESRQTPAVAKELKPWDDAVETCKAELNATKKGLDRLKSDSQALNENLMRALQGQIYQTEVMKVVTRQNAVAQELQNKENKVLDLEKALIYNENEQYRIATSMRNEISRKMIRELFASGQRELDQEVAAEGDGDGIQYDIVERDYEQLAKDLQVFCVSALASHKLRGSSEDAALARGFIEMEQTEVPQLLQHCINITEPKRKQAALVFLNDVISRLLRVWLYGVTGDGIRSSSPEDIAKVQANFMQCETHLLESILRVIDNDIAAYLDRVRNSIVNPLPRATVAVKVASVAQTTNWGAHRKVGGIAWNTYRALGHHAGAYSNKKRNIDIDVNATFSRPFIQSLLAAWDSRFGPDLDQLLRNAPQDISVTLGQFHLSVQGVAASLQISDRPFHAIQLKQAHYINILQDKIIAAREQMKEVGKDVNRMFKTEISTRMHATYTTVATQRGKGAFENMKNAMMNQVQRNNGQMFNDTANAVSGALLADLPRVGAELRDGVEGMLKEMLLEYKRAVFGGGAVGENQIVSAEVKEVRIRVLEIVEMADQVFVDAMRDV